MNNLPDDMQDFLNEIEKIGYKYRVSEYFDMYDYLISIDNEIDIQLNSLEFKKSIWSLIQIDVFNGEAYNSKAFKDLGQAIDYAFLALDSNDDAFKVVITNIEIK